MNRVAITFAVACALALPWSVHARGNADNGKSKSQACAACHGPEGNKPVGPDFPIIAGQHADYLSKALRDYKSGARANPIMKGFAASLSKQDIEDLAAYFAGQASPLQTHR